MGTISLAKILLGIFAIFLVAVDAIVSDLPESLPLYADIHAVNRSESLRRIKELPIVLYKFLYDSVSDRVQLGALGSEVQRLFPEAVDVLPSTAFLPSQPQGSSSRPLPVTVTNFPVVDKNVLFMHGLAALQELIEKFDRLQEEVDNLGERDEGRLATLQAIQEKLSGEISYQLQSRLEASQLEASISSKRLSLETKRSEQETERMKKQLEEEKALLEFEERLARDRLSQQEEMTKQALIQQLSLERELADRKEALQKQHAESIQEARQQRARDLEAKRLEFEKEKIRAEIEARTQQERVSEEIAIRKLQAQSRLDTERMVEGIKSITSQLTNIAKDIFSRPQQVLALSGIILALIAAYYLIREFSALVRQLIQARIGKPTLVRETSFHWSLLPNWLLDLLSWRMSQEPFNSSLQQLEKDFKDIILSPDDKARVVNLALATRNTRQSGAPYRHVLLHGPPGTGKTLIARRLAKSSGMDYAILSGGDVAPLGEDAVNQLHALFRWASRSRRGLLVFIDEAEAFLSSRASHSAGAAGAAGGNRGIAADTHIRNALNALLYQTGTPSKNFLMVLATNRPEDLDSAILDRVDVSLQISLPALEQRVDLIKLYFQTHVVNVARDSQRSGVVSWLRGGAKRFVDDACSREDSLALVASRTEGFSGREIAKLFISAQYAMYLAEKQTLTWRLLSQTVDSKVAEHAVKMSGFSMNPKEPRRDEHEIDDPDQDCRASAIESKSTRISSNAQSGEKAAKASPSSRPRGSR